MSGFKPIPAKVHKPKRHVREITSKPLAYTPRLRKLTFRREAKPVAHRRTFFVRKQPPAPKAPIRYKYKPEVNINGKFVLLLLALAALVTIFVLLLGYLMK